MLARPDMRHLFLEKAIEQLAAKVEVHDLAVGEPVDVLEQSEARDPHLIPVRSHETLEPPHEQGQHLVDVDDQQRRGRIDVRFGDIVRGGVWFQLENPAG